MNKKSMVLCGLLLLGTTSCSSSKDVTVNIPAVNVPSTSVTSVPVTQAEADGISSATVVAAEASYEENFHEIFQCNSQDEFLLWQQPTADYLVLQALHTPLSETPTSTLEIIHSAIYETLGDSYESSVEGYLATLEEGSDTIETLPDYGDSDNYGISVIESFVAGAVNDTSELIRETLISGSVTADSARLYLPKVGTNEYYIVTIQEISTNNGACYSCVELGIATISAFTSNIALDYLISNIASINADYGLDLETPSFAESPDAEPEEELDGMSSATPEFHLIDTKDGSGNLIQVSVAHFPNKAVYLDYSAFDVALSFGIAGSYEQLVIQNDIPSVLKPGLVDDVNLSTYLEDGDLSLIEALEPDVIFANQEIAHLYDSLSQIAPVIMTDTSEGTSFESYQKNAERVSIMYSVAYIIDGFSADYALRLDHLSQTLSGKTAVVVSALEGSLSAVNSNTELLFDTLGLRDVSGSLGGMSTEDFMALSPDYVFVLDYDGTFPELDLTVISLDVPAWTLHSRGVLGMEQMITDLETGIS